MILARSLLCGLLVVAGSLPAAAQGGTDPATKFSGFLCEINLQENGLPGGIVYTFDSEKLCTGSAPNENIKLDCSAKIPNWTGGRVNKDVACTISGAACGVRGILTATNNKLKIDASGNATLSCQYKG
jgi:hypothetical protein